MNIEHRIKTQVSQALEELYQQQIPTDRIQIKQIPKHLEGDYSIVTFPFAKQLGKNPNDIATELATQLVQQAKIFSAAEAVKGFCNLSIGDGYWTDLVHTVLATENYGLHPSNGETVVVEYASPNTNKPLHLGHVRNNLLGFGTAEILKAAGYAVKKVQIVNDRGVHICKSMLAWQKWGNNETPQSTHSKGDHFVGKYYVEFEKKFQVEYKAWQETATAKDHLEKWLADEKATGRIIKTWEKKNKEATPEALAAYFFKDVFKNKYFNQYSALGIETKEMLQAWEAGDEAVRNLWTKMNGWVYEGFDKTYRKMGVDFDKLYYESETYLTGKDLVSTELAKENSIFFQKEDGSVWIDLSDAGLDQKAVLRKDGTSMYITQDLGTATLRFQDFDMQQMVYVVANEQDYHFKVLFETLKRLGYPFANNCHHLSYGMVNLTTGKMKSREGTVVDADDLMAELIENVRQESESRETLSELPPNEQLAIWEAVALGALKFYILKVEPKKNMTFDPKQSIELQGQTGPYIQNAHVRTQSVQRMVANKGIQLEDYNSYSLEEVERDILILVQDFPNVVLRAAQGLNPAEVANYLYDLAKAYHKFWNDVKILDEDNPAATSFRLDMSKAVAKVLQAAGQLIGIEMPDRM